MSRHKLNIDPELVQGYARFGASNRDIAEVIGCDEGTIRKRFSAELVKGRGDRKMKLRQWQYEAASKGNIAMLIWLGKQELGQADKQEQNIDSTVTVRDVTVDRSKDDPPTKQE